MTTLHNRTEVPRRPHRASRHHRTAFDPGVAPAEHRSGAAKTGLLLLISQIVGTLAGSAIVALGSLGSPTGVAEKTRLT